MPVSLFALALLTLLALPVTGDIAEHNIHAASGPVQPALPPDTAVSTNEMPAPSATDLRPRSTSAHPTQVLIPAIGVNSYVVDVGVNALGEMDVPDGSTLNVGWYKHGTVPGETGSAVLDAHVFAAFKKLKNVAIGNRIYIADAHGTMREFEVIASKVYPYTEVPMETIFTDATGSYLNLITCEGRYSIRDGTYSHRRVVYAELVQ